MMPPFVFVPGSTVSLAVTDSTGRVAISASGKNVLVTNTGAQVCYIEFGSDVVVATTADCPILPGAAYIMSKDSSTYVAGICDSGLTTTLKVTAIFGE